MRTTTHHWTMLSACAITITMTALACKDSVTSLSSDGAKVPGADAPVMSLAAFNQEVCGIIPATVVITENTRLTCDVQCVNTTGPCIQFGRDNITLFLDGFTMSGSAAPPTVCAASPATGTFPNPGPFPYDGISTAGFDHVRIRGPGMVQTFRRHGIFLFSTDRAIVENVTVHFNCYSGIFMGGSHENLISENVSVRNGSASAMAPCGGSCVTNSNANRVRRNHFYGNGSIVAGPPAGSPNDFGVGLVGTSRDNVIEENSIGGNINGILLYPLTTGNVIRWNVIAGNPPVQVSVTAGSPIGVDIRDASVPGANTFTENRCITYEGASTPPPCPNFPLARGHF